MEIIILLLPLLILALVVFVSLREIKQVNNVLYRMGFRKRRFWISQKFTETYNGHSLSLTLTQDVLGSREKILHVSIPARSPLSFSIWERDDASFSKVNTIFEDGNTAQVDPDGRLLIASPDISKVTEFFSDETLQKAVKDLFQGWIKNIEVTGDAITATVSIKSKADPSLLEDVMPALFVLKAKLETSNLRVEKSRQTSKYLVTALYTIPVVCIIVELVLAVLLNIKARKDFDVLNTFSLIKMAFLLFLPVGAIYLLTAYFVSKKYLPSGKTFFTCLLICHGWFVASIPLIMNINGYFDRSTGIEKEFTVVDKYTRKNSYYLVLKENEQNSSTFSILVREEEYNKTLPYKASVRMVVKDGAFKVKWRAFYKIEYHN